MNIKQYGTMLAAGVLLALTTNPVAATVCDQPSPLRESLGEDYWDIEFAIDKANEPKSSPTTKAQTKLAAELLERLGRSNYRKANGMRYVCKGAPDRRRTVEYDSQLNIAYTPTPIRRRDDGAYPLDYVKVSERKGEITLRMAYFEHGEYLWHYDHEGHHDREIVESDFITKLIIDLPDVSNWLVVSDNSIQTSQVNRRQNAIGASMIQQIDTELVNSSDGIRLSQTVYINGNRESWATWTLVK